VSGFGPDDAAERLAGFADVVEAASWGERAFFVNPGRSLKSGAYFATIKTADGPKDRASRLDRPGAWRLNFGADPKVFASLFGPRPARPAKGCVVAGAWDFAAEDAPTPHPVYGWMGWIAVVSPSRATFERLGPAIASAHAKAAATARRRLASAPAR